MHDQQATHLWPDRRPAGGSASPARRTAARVVDDPRSVVLAAGAGYRPGWLRGRVRVLQRRLGTAGFTAGRVDGRYGPLTRQAVSRFQHADGLTVDGIAGARTLAALHASRIAGRGGLAPGAGYHQPAGSLRVRALQQHLQTTGFTPGPADGRYGPLTTHAVSRYQHAHTLPATGIATPRTLDALHIPTSTPTLTPPPPPRHAARSTAPHHPRRQAHRRSTRRQTTAAARTSPGSSEPPAGPPLTPILLGLLAIGAATITASYHHTRTQTRTRTRTTPRSAPSKPARPATSTKTSTPTNSPDSSPSPPTAKPSSPATSPPTSSTTSTPPPPPAGAPPTAASPPANGKSSNSSTNTPPPNKSPKPSSSHPPPSTATSKASYANSASTPATTPSPPPTTSATKKSRAQKPPPQPNKHPPTPPTISAILDNDKHTMRCSSTRRERQPRSAPHHPQGEIHARTHHPRARHPTRRAAPDP